MPTVTGALNPKSIMPGLTVDDINKSIDEIAARVNAAGIKLDVEPFDTPWKTRQFELTDPSGFKLTISSEWPSH